MAKSAIISNPPPQGNPQSVCLVNQTRAATLATAVEHARSPAARMKGLLGRPSLADAHALIIEPCTSIHTFFMKFAIDVLFLDRTGKVLRAIESMKPWRATRIYPRATCVVELPAGTIARTQTQEADTVLTQLSP